MPAMTRSRARGALSSVDTSTTARRGPAAPPPPAITNADQLLTTHQVATQVQVDVKTVRLWIAERELPAYRVGRTLRVHPEALATFLAHRVVAEAQAELLGP